MILLGLLILVELVRAGFKIGFYIKFKDRNTYRTQNSGSSVNPISMMSGKNNSVKPKGRPKLALNLKNKDYSKNEVKNSPGILKNKIKI